MVHSRTMNVKGNLRYGATKDLRPGTLNVGPFTLSGIFYLDNKRGPEISALPQLQCSVVCIFEANLPDANELC